MLPHANIVTDEGYEATKEANGLTEGSHCTDCGTVLVAQKTLYYFDIMIYNDTYGMVEKTYSSSYAAGDTVDLHAYVSSERGFAGWYEDYTLLSSSLEFSYTMPAHSVELLVCFTEYPDMDVWFGNTATEFSSGTGEEDDPFVIRSGAELKLLETLVNSAKQYGKKYYSELYYLLDRSIDMTLGGEWTPIGSYNGEANSRFAFKGNFNGGDNVIFGLELPAKASSVYTGMFGYATDATFEDLIFENVKANVNFKELDKNEYYFGVLLGYGKSGITINGVQVHETVVFINVTAGDRLVKVSYIGGVAGNVSMNKDGIASGIIFNGSITVATDTNAYVGGLFGECVGTNVTLDDCHTYSDIGVGADGDIYVGGLLCTFGSMNLYNCTVEGNLSADNSKVENAVSAYAGGLIGGYGTAYNKHLNLELCSYQGNIDVDSIGIVKAYGISVSSVDTAKGCTAKGNIDVKTEKGNIIDTDEFCSNSDKVSAEGCMTEVTISVTEVEIEE